MKKILFILLIIVFGCKKELDIADFLDDFSYNSYFPDNLLWEDSAVFVNRSYPINPVTLGVATFDGLDANGMAYDISASTQGKRADSLTSKAIDLSAVDSAYLLFYYQAEGLGDNPQTEDSLVLEFLLHGCGHQVN